MDTVVKLDNVKIEQTLTTGQIAKLCGVAPRTVSKWFDSGKLKGYRIPTSLDRRVTVGNLIEFCKVHGLPLPISIEQKQLAYCEQEVSDHFPHAIKCLDSFAVALSMGKMQFGSAVITDHEGLSVALKVTAALHRVNEKCAVAIVCDPSCSLQPASRYFKMFHAPIDIKDVLKFFDRAECVSL